MTQHTPGTHSTDHPWQAADATLVCRRDAPVTVVVP
jgi:hypothetical protein